MKRCSIAFKLCSNCLEGTVRYEHLSGMNKIHPLLIRNMALIARVLFVASLKQVSTFFLRKLLFNFPAYITILSFKNDGSQCFSYRT